MLGAEQVIAIDQFDYRLEMARNRAGATDTINFNEDADVVEQLKVLTGGGGRGGRRPRRGGPRPARRTPRCRARRGAGPPRDRPRPPRAPPRPAAGRRP